MFESIEWEDWISPDAWEDSDPGNLTPCPSLELSAPVAKLHHLGQFTFDDDQLQYLLVNLVWQSNSIQDGIKVLRYKWPSEFSRLSSSDLMTVLESVESHGEAMQLFRGTEKFIYGHCLRPRRTTPLPDVIQLVNTFKIELREAEVFGVRQFAEAMEPEVVEITLISKLFSDFSSRDIALGLTHRYSRFGQNHSCRYVWMLPFTKDHVEYIWDISQLAQNEHLKVTAGTTGQQREELLTAFSKDILAGRADKTLAFDPRSYGNEPSAASLPEEVLRLFLSRADGQYTFEALITWQAGHMAPW